VTDASVRLFCLALTAARLVQWVLPGLSSSEKCLVAESQQRESCREHTEQATNRRKESSKEKGSRREARM